MKRKVKRYDAGGYGRFVEDSPKSIEDMKSNIAAGSPAVEEDTGMRAGRNLALEEDTVPKAKSRAAAPKVKTGSGASGFGLKDKEMESASSVMKRGQAGASDSGRNPSLDRLMADREANASREARRKSAMVDRAKAGIPERRSNVDVAKERLGMKKGGMAKSASARADGCAIRGKTRA